MEETKPTRSPLLSLEDWWTVWFGMIIILVATGLGIATYSGVLAKTKVPKLGKWVSDPLDVFYAAKKETIKLDEPTSLGELAKAIDASKAEASALVEPAAGGVRLRVGTDRDGPGETISLKANLAAGEELSFSKEEPDSGGLGSRAYVSQVLPSADVLVGQGLVTVTDQRKSSIVLPLVLSFLLVALLTAIGVSIMGQSGSRYALAFAVIVLLAVLASGIANQSQIKAYGLGYAFWALLLGLLISNTVGTPGFLTPGVRTEMYIKTGLVLLGAEILFGKILSLGPPGLLVAWVVTPVVTVFMFIFGVRVLKMASKSLVIIIAAATSVCGVSAAIAAAGASRAKKEELTLAVGMTLIFTVLMMIFMPLGIKYLGMGDVLGAAWMGGTIDSTGAVVAAGAMLGPRAETVAAVVKMIQNVLIGVLGFCIAVYWVTSVERDPDAPRPSLFEVWVRFPKFIVGFVAASILFSFVLTPLFGGLFQGDGLKLVESGVIKAVTNPLRGWFFCMAFVSIGLESNFRDLARQVEGGKPLLLYIVGQSFNLVLTLFMAWLAFMVLFPDSV